MTTPRALKLPFRPSSMNLKTELPTTTSSSNSSRYAVKKLRSNLMDLQETPTEELMFAPPILSQLSLTSPISADQLMSYLRSSPRTFVPITPLKLRPAKSTPLRLELTSQPSQSTVTKTPSQLSSPSLKPKRTSVTASLSSFGSRLNFRTLASTAVTNSLSILMTTGSSFRPLSLELLTSRTTFTFLRTQSTTSLANQFQFQTSRTLSLLNGPQPTQLARTLALLLRISQKTALMRSKTLLPSSPT